MTKDNYDSAMWELECMAEKMAIEHNISKIEAKEIICYELNEPDYDY